MTLDLWPHSSPICDESRGLGCNSGTCAHLLKAPTNASSESHPSRSSREECNPHSHLLPRPKQLSQDSLPCSGATTRPVVNVILNLVSVEVYASVRISNILGVRNMEQHARRPRLLLADDNEMILAKVGEILSRDFDVVALARTGEEAILAALRLKPDVLVLDIVMPELDGIHAARALRAMGCESRIVFLSVIENLQVIQAALATTANGFVFMCRILPDLPQAIRDVLSGKSFVSGKGPMAHATGSPAGNRGELARLLRVN